MHIYNYNNNNNNNGFHLYNTMFQVLAPGTFIFSAYAPPWGSYYPIPSWGNQKVKRFSTASKWQRCNKPIMYPAPCSAPAIQSPSWRLPCPPLAMKNDPTNPVLGWPTIPFARDREGSWRTGFFNAKSRKVLGKLGWVSHLPRVSEHRWLSLPVHVCVCMCAYVCVLTYSRVPERSTSLPSQAQQFSVRVKVL